MKNKTKRNMFWLLAKALGKVCFNDSSLLGCAEVSGGMLGREEGVIRALALVRVLDGEQQVFDAARLCIDTLVKRNDFLGVACTRSEVFDALRQHIIAEVVKVSVALVKCSTKESVKFFALLNGKESSHVKNPVKGVIVFGYTIMYHTEEGLSNSKRSENVRMKSFFVLFSRVLYIMYHAQKICQI